MKIGCILFTAIAILSFCDAVSWAERNDYDYIAGLIGQNKLDEAEFALTARLAPDDNKDVVALSLLGEVYRKKGEKAKALTYLRKAVLLDSSYPAAHLYLGKVYFMMQKLAESEGEFNEFRAGMRTLAGKEEFKEFYIKSLHGIIISYMGFKMYAEAGDILKEILELSPNDQTALYNMGIYCYVYDRNRSRAYAYFKKALDIKEDNYISSRARYAIEFMRANPDPRMEPDMSFIDQEYSE